MTTRARAAYALRCPGQCSEEKDTFGSFSYVTSDPPGVETAYSQNSVTEAFHSLMT